MTVISTEDGRPQCLARLPAGDRHRLVLAAVRAARHVPLQPALDAAA